MSLRKLLTNPETWDSVVTAAIRSHKTADQAYVAFVKQVLLHFGTMQPGANSNAPNIDITTEAIRAVLSWKKPELTSQLEKLMKKAKEMYEIQEAWKQLVRGIRDVTSGLKDEEELEEGGLEGAKEMVEYLKEARDEVKSEYHMLENTFDLGL